LPTLRGASSVRSGQRPARTRWLAVAAACLVVGGVTGYALGSSGDDADLETLAQRASSEPGGVLATLDDTAGRPVARVVTDQDGAYMVLEGLQDLPRGRAYQLWSLTGPEPVSLGMLGREGTNTVAFRLPPTITELAISVEPTSGEVAPSGDFQASGSVSGRDPVES
jgi:anti-sigma-K factor RskA